jgi:hypothetical protein
LLPYVGRWTRRLWSAAGSSWRPPSASGRVTSGRGFIPLCSTPYETGVHVLVGSLLVQENGLDYASEGPVYRRISRFEKARFDRSWTTCPTSTKYRLGCNLKRPLFVTGRFSPCRDREARTVVTSTVNGRFPAGELTRRAPSFLPRARWLVAPKPTHISHSQSHP